MKRIYVACLLIILLAKIAVAQSARVNIVIANTAPLPDRTYISNPLAKFGEKGSLILFNDQHKGFYTLNLDAPQAVGFTSYFSNVKGNPTSKFFWFALFLTPGDDIRIQIDPNKQDNNITVSGKGSANNQPGLLKLTGMDTDPFKKDTTPNRVMGAINAQSIKNKATLNGYALQFKQSDIPGEKPSTEFLKNAQFNQQYFAARIFYEFNHNNNFFKSEAGLLKWKNTEDSLFRTVKLSNDAALGAFNYQQLLTNFLIREKERLWNQQRSHPEVFYKEWFGTTDTAQGKKQFKNEQRSLLSERIINKYFIGKTAEYMYSVLLKMQLGESNYQNITVIFDHFKQKYPNSKYIAQFSGPINEVVEKQNHALNDKMVFLADNGTKLNTMEDVIALTKGKTVFVDMWGTWCGPCREDIEKDSQLLRAHFAGKDIVFLYVANNDLQNEKEWKRLIAYYHMEGNHILANQQLTDNMMHSVNATGFPTYIIIKKDGSYKVANSQYPMNLKATMKELDGILTK
jgi:thiol-disulfide isomerase/thioredoxin